MRKLYLEDIFGFDSKENYQKIQPRKEDDLPIQPFGASRLFRHLLKKKLGEVEPYERFTDEIRWGTTTGTMRVKQSPNGMINISRLCNDTNGEYLWVCKKMYHINNEFTGKEENVATDIFSAIQKLAKEPIDSAIENFNNLGSLVKSISKDIRMSIGEMFSFEDIKQVNKDNYIIYFSISAGGVGYLIGQRERSAGLTPFLIIDISCDQECGILRVIINTISIEPEGGFWQINIPYFDEKFLPTQNKNEIAQTIITSIKHF